jgi:hypothetical protein
MFSTHWYASLQVLVGILAWLEYSYTHRLDAPIPESPASIPDALVGESQSIVESGVALLNGSILALQPTKATYYVRHACDASKNRTEALALTPQANLVQVGLDENGYGPLDSVRLKWVQSVYAHANCSNVCPTS